MHDRQIRKKKASALALGAVLGGLIGGGAADAAVKSSHPSEQTVLDGGSASSSQKGAAPFGAGFKEPAVVSGNSVTGTAGPCWKDGGWTVCFDD